MKKSLTLIAASAFLVAPSLVFAQIPTGALTDTVKDKAVETVLDNATTDDALIAGKTLLKGGSKEDAAIAVVKGRAENRVEGLTGTKVDLDDLSKDGMVDAAKDVAIDKAKGSATKYTNGAPSVGKTSSGSVLNAGKKLATDQVKSSATKYGDKTAGSHTTHSAPIIHKSGGTIVQPAPTTTTNTTTTTTTTTAPLNCPSGTKDAGDGTCMITGDWKF